MLRMAAGRQLISVAALLIFFTAAASSFAQAQYSAPAYNGGTITLTVPGQTPTQPKYQKNTTGNSFYLAYMERDLTLGQVPVQAARERYLLSSPGLERAVRFLRT